MNNTTKVIFQLLMFFFFEMQLAFAQEDSIHFYYPSVFIGVDGGVNIDKADYHYVTSNKNGNPSHHNRSLIFGSKSRASLTFKTKFFGFSISIPALKRKLDNEFITADRNIRSPSRKSFSIVLYPRRFLVKANYTRAANPIFENGDTVLNGAFQPVFSNMKELRADIFNSSFTFFFNRRFSFSKLYSFMYFPKKTVFSWLSGAEIFYEDFSVPQNGFLPKNIHSSLANGRKTDIFDWTYVNHSRFTGITLQGGLTYLLTHDQTKRPTHMQFFHGNTFSFGPNIYQGILDSQDPQYDQRKINSGLVFSLTDIEGINFKYGYIQWNGNINLMYFFLPDFRVTRNFATMFLTLGARIPSKRPYEKVDREIERFMKKFKKTK